MIRRYCPTITMAAIISGAFASPVQANPGPIPEVFCGFAEDMRQTLEHRLGATLAWQGLRSPDQIMEIWEDRQGDWTLVIAYANGNRCIVAMGSRISGFADLPHG